jgi:hypothetical protein
VTGMCHLQSADEVLDYSQDWSEWVEVGDALLSSTWEIRPSATLTLESLDVDASTTSVTVSGLTSGLSYQLTRCHVRRPDRTARQGSARSAVRRHIIFLFAKLFRRQGLNIR